MRQRVQHLLVGDAGNYVPLSVFVDIEPTVVGEVRGTDRQLPSNFARTWTRRWIVDLVTKLADNCFWCTRGVVEVPVLVCFGARRTLP